MEQVEMKFLPEKKAPAKKEFRRMKTLIFSNPKVGKTTFCSHIPGAVFAAFEDGLSYLEAAAAKIETWDQFIELCKEICTEEHEYTTLVVDVADLAYVACEDFICVREKVQKISDLDYGAGFKMVKQEFLRVLNKVSLAGFGVVLTSHSKQKEVKKKTSTYTIMDTSLSGSASEAVCGFVDHIFYAFIDENGKRLMRTKPTKYINAGDRSGKLPEIMPFNYPEFEKTFNGLINQKEGE